MLPPCIQTVLCIDDEQFVRRSVTAWLEDSEYTVFGAANGRQGLQLFDSNKPDLVLLDLRMPEIDGFELLEQIRQKKPQTPVIVISGTGEMGDVIRALRLGAWNYITKPVVDMDVITHAIEQCDEKLALIRENERYREHLEQRVLERTAQLERAVAVSEALANLSKDIMRLKSLSDIALRTGTALESIGQARVGVVAVKDSSNQLICPMADQSGVELFLREAVGRSAECVLQIGPEKGTLVPVLNQNGEQRGFLIAVGGDDTHVHKIASVFSLALERERLSLELEQEKKAAATALKVKSTFLSQMGHELRTPLAGTMGMLELIQKSRRVEQMHELAQSAEKSSRSLLEMINRILDFVRLTQNSFQPEFVEFCPRTLVREVYVSYLEKAHAKSLEFECRIDSSLPPLFQSDPDAIRQILLALVDNAIKFSAKGKVELHAGALDNKDLLILVSDEGPGIDPEHQDYIFEHFTQVEDVYTRKHGGAGLGLAMALKLAQHLGGRLRLDSNLKSGACFALSLPGK